MPLIDTSVTRSIPTREDQTARRLLWAIFLFFYLPLVYWSGFALKARAVTDFPSFYYGARMAFLEGKVPYGPHAMEPYANELHRAINPYLAPPPSLIGFWPLARMPIGVSFVIFTVISHASLLLSIWLILNKLTPLPADRRFRRAFLCAALAYMLIFDAVTATLNLGQTNLIALALLCLAFTALKNGTSNWRIALPLAGAIVLKASPALLLIFLLLERRFRATVYTCISLAGFLLAAALALPKQIWNSWAAEVLPAAFVARDWIPVSFMWNQSLSGFTARLLRENNLTRAPLQFPSLAQLPSLAQPMAVALSLAVLLVTVGVCLPKPRQPLTEYAEMKRADDKVAAFLLMMYMVSPLSWDHHLVLILGVTVLAMARLADGLVQWKTAVGITAALFLIAWQLPLDFEGVRKSWWTLIISVKLYAVTVLWVFFIVRIYRGRSSLIVA